MTCTTDRSLRRIKLHCAYYGVFSKRMKEILLRMEIASVQKDNASFTAYCRELAALNECTAFVRWFMLNLERNHDRRSTEMVVEKLFSRRDAAELSEADDVSVSTAYRRIGRTIQDTVDCLEQNS